MAVNSLPFNIHPGTLIRRLFKVLREKPAMVNLMRDIPQRDTQPVAHARLLICMFVPFFDLDDLKHVGESWPAAYTRVDTTGIWDSRTYSFRLNIAGMLAQKLAAAEEKAKRNAENAAFSGSTNGTSDNSAEILLQFYGDDDTGVSIIPTSARRSQTMYFVKDALKYFLAADFSGDNSVPDAWTPLLRVPHRKTLSLTSPKFRLAPAYRQKHYPWRDKNVRWSINHPHARPL